MKNIANHEDQNKLEENNKMQKLSTKPSEGRENLFFTEHSRQLRNVIPYLQICSLLRLRNDE